MNNIIKRRHTAQYAQIHNTPLQHDLVDLRAIGLLSHLMSLPSDWVIYKTQIYKKFSRKNVEAAWKELAGKHYIIGFNCYIDGKKQSFYNVSDIPFISEEFDEFVHETILELINSGVSVKSLSPMNGGTLDIPDNLTNVLNVHQIENAKDFTTVPRVQYSQYSTLSTSTNENITNKKNKDDENISNISLSNQNLKTNTFQTQLMPTLTLSNDDLLWITDKVREMYTGKIQKRSFDSVLKKCINNYKQGTVPNYENYLITSVENKITELEMRREKEKRLLDLGSKSKQQNKKVIKREIIPDWLHEQKAENNNVENKLKPLDKNIELERTKLLEELQKYKRNKNN
ncbi:hypothetical protein [Bacillus pseudomycoides]|uniref:hypothetical protein n=1 Tax=Bacillus pseudomycoides TaxID=64104 RepID=UPI000BFE0037|nr:hypothetical protein [Bacillus pseudomycoides]PGD99987.1 hypothetical protein COM49_22175 [Bacillus pseudomycoides]PHG23843.1 hypothetical protein COI47_09910 [Bacillus pseudomycoides]